MTDEQPQPGPPSMGKVSPIQPRPAPATHQLVPVKVRENGQERRMFALIISTVSGSCTTFWTAEEARELGEKMIRIATGGLTVARDLPPQPPPRPSS